MVLNRSNGLIDGKADAGLGYSQNENKKKKLRREEEINNEDYWKKNKMSGLRSSKQSGLALPVALDQLLLILPLFSSSMNC
jgi:hypothetical protein